MKRRIAVRQYRVPFLPEKRIEDQAQLLLDEWAESHSPITEPPVPVEDILELHVELAFIVADLQAELGHRDVLGGIWFGDRMIKVDQSLDPSITPKLLGRYRFTLAHEVGHWRLHRQHLMADPTTKSLFEANCEPAFVQRSSANPPEEIQANAFAGLGCFILATDRIIRQRNVRRDALGLQTGQELTVPVTSIGAESLGPYLVMTISPLQHHSSATTFGVSVCLIHGNVQAQAVTILHQHVGTVTQQRRLATTLASQSRFRIDDASMRLVRTFLPAEVHRRIATIIVIGVIADLPILAVQWPEALHRGERLDQRAVHAEVILADQPFQNRSGDHSIEEVPNEPVSVEPLAVHAEHLRRPHRLRWTHVQEPAVEKVVPDLLAQLDLATDAVEPLQQQRFDQSLRRDAGPFLSGHKPGQNAATSPSECRRHGS